VRILQLSDLHLRRLPGADQDGVDARATLVQMLQDCRHLEDVDLVVVSGDVADDGLKQTYADALTLVGDLARRHGAAQAYCTGNHDRRDAFAAVLGSGHFDRTGQPSGRPAPSALGERAAVSQVAGYRVITLDSLVPGELHGWIGDDQLHWLQRVLADPSPAGTILVVHHPPIALDRGAQPSVGLQNATALSEVIEGADVLIMLCGHFHVQLAGRLGAVPVWVGPGIYSRIDLTAPSRLDRAVRGAAATVVELGGPSAPLFYMLHARDPRAGEALYLADALTQEDVAHE
jgi:Icc protein